jgi:hypothetical protein
MKKSPIAFVLFVARFAKFLSFEDLIFEYSYFCIESFMLDNPAYFGSILIFAK